MKKTLFSMMVLVTAVSLASCKKDEVPAPVLEAAKESGFTPMVINAVTETVGAKSQVVFLRDLFWEDNDQIYVCDAAGNHDTFTLSAGAGTKNGTFTQDGTVSLAGEVKAYYPASLVDDNGKLIWPALQTVDQKVPLYSTQNISGPGDKTFRFSCLGAVLNIVLNTTQENVTLSSIKIKDNIFPMSGEFKVLNGQAVLKGNKAGTTLYLDKGKALGNGAHSFNIVIPANEYPYVSIILTDTEASICRFLGGSINLDPSTVGKLTLTANSFVSNCPDNAIKGLFTVDDKGDADPSNDVKVRFSKGNLYAKKEGSTWKWHFYNSQPQFNSYNDEKRSDDSRFAGNDETEIDLFTWGYSNATPLSPTGEYREGNHTTDGECLIYDKSSPQGDDWGVAYCESNGVKVGTWRTLTKDEWQYLISHHETKIVSINKQRYGYAIAPDNASLAEIKTEYSSLYNLERGLNSAAGVVFLPYAGQRNGNYIRELEYYGLYWSSTAKDTWGAYRLSFDIYGAGIGAKDKSYGYSVRLVSDVPLE